MKARKLNNTTALKEFMSLNSNHPCELRELKELSSAERDELGAEALAWFKANPEQIPEGFTL